MCQRCEAKMWAYWNLLQIPKDCYGYHSWIKWMGNKCRKESMSHFTLGGWGNISLMLKNLHKCMLDLRGHLMKQLSYLGHPGIDNLVHGGLPL